MPARLRLLPVVLLAVACGDASSTGAPPDAAAPPDDLAAAPDEAAPDLTVPDLALPVDAAMAIDAATVADLHVVVDAAKAPDLAVAADLTVVADATAPPDLHVAPDLTAVDLAPACSMHTLKPVALTTLEKLDATPYVGASLRVRIAYPLRAGCDLPGPVSVVVTPGNATDAVVVTAHAWVSSDPSSTCGAPALDTRIVVPSDHGASNPTAVVSDGAPGGTRTLTVSLAARPSASCTLAQPGDPCQLDCQCAAGNVLGRCIPTSSTGGRCGITCAEDADCQAAAVPDCAATGSFAPSLCAAGPACTSSSACPPGQACVAVGSSKACRPVETGAGAACTCSATCGAGGVCTTAAGGAPRCAIACVGDGDCPVGGQCASGLCAMAL